MSSRGRPVLSLSSDLYVVTVVYPPEKLPDDPKCVGFMPVYASEDHAEKAAKEHNTTHIALQQRKQT